MFFYGTWEILVIPFLFENIRKIRRNIKVNINAVRPISKRLHQSRIISKVTRDIGMLWGLRRVRCVLSDTVKHYAYKLSHLHIVSWHCHTIPICVGLFIFVIVMVCIY